MPLKRDNPQSSAFTADFRHEFEAHTRQLLRERFLWFNGLLGGLWTVMFAFGVYSFFSRMLGAREAASKQNVETGVTTSQIVNWIASPAFELVAIVAYATSFVLVKRGKLSDADLLKLTYWLVFIDGALRIAMSTLNVGGGGGLPGVMFAHALACALLPWTLRQAAGPIIPLLVLSALQFSLTGASGWEKRLILIAMSPLVAVPGLLVSYFKHSSRMKTYRTHFFQRRYGELRRELVDARRIHESLFPAPRAAGPVRFMYRYEPMRQIGGDYLYASHSRVADGQDGKLSVVVMDVTGHGIPAALTVNRLHGELERVFAENPAVQPGEVLKLLNRYVHLTLANHSVYVTALCMKVDCPAGKLEYASGGHPPAFLRAVDASLHELPSTAFVLGACADADFDPAPVTHAFGPGDAIIAYTDGAIEARDRAGRMLGVQGLSRLIASSKPNHENGWSDIVLSAVESHRYGPPADDTLVIEITRPVTS